MTIGEIDGYPITYDSTTDTTSCKGFTVAATIIIRAYHSSLDRERLSSDIVRHKNKVWGTSLGCFQASPELSKKLINNLENARNTENKKHQAKN